MAWNKLFQFSDRCFLEENLNLFCRDYPLCEVKVWTDNDMWYAHVTYEYGDIPTYPKVEKEDG
jgi:hypothetical protein